MSTTKPARKRGRKITEQVGTITTTVLPDGMTPGHPLITHYPRHLRWDENLVILQERGACRPRKNGKRGKRQLYKTVAVTLLHVAGRITLLNPWAPKHREKNAAVRVATVISQCEDFAATHPAGEGFVLAGKFYGKGRGAKVNGEIAEPGIKDLMDAWNLTKQGQTPKGKIAKSFIAGFRTRPAWTGTKIKRHIDGSITEYSPTVTAIQAVAVELKNEKLRDLNNDLAAERFDNDIMPVITDEIRHEPIL